MERRFISAPRTHFTTVFPPSGVRFHTRSGRRGNKGSRRSYTFEDHPAAIEGYLRLIDDLLEDGHIELPPWQIYRRGQDRLLLRMPCIPEFTSVISRAGRRPSRRTRRYERTIEAIQAYNRYLKARIREGFALDIPEWHEGYDTPDEDFQAHEVHREGLLYKRYYQRTTAPGDEFGPEWWYRDGQVWQHNFQCQSQKEGASVIYKDGHLAGLTIHHRGPDRGVIFVHDPDGTINYTAFAHGEARTHCTLFEHSKLSIFSLEGQAKSGLRRGLWETWKEDAHIQSFYIEPGIPAWVKRFRVPEGTLSEHKIYEDNELVFVEIYYSNGICSERQRHRKDGYLEFESFHPNGARHLKALYHVETQTNHGPYLAFDTQDRLITQGTLDTQGRRIGTWEEIKPDNRIVKVYQAPNVFKSITFHRLSDDSIEQQKDFDDQGRLCLVKTYDEAGILIWQRTHPEQS